MSVYQRALLLCRRASSISTFLFDTYLCLQRMGVSLAFADIYICLYVCKEAFAEKHKSTKEPYLSAEEPPSYVQRRRLLQTYICLQRSLSLQRSRLYHTTQKVSLERGLDPIYPLSFDLYNLLRTKGLSDFHPFASE